MQRREGREFWHAFIETYSKKFVSGMMEKAIIAIIVEFYFVVWEIWDDTKLDRGIEIMENTESKTITKFTRNSGWDFSSAFVKGAPSNSIDVSFKLLKYAKTATMAFGICPQESYKQNIGHGLECYIGNKGYPNSFSYNAYKGQIMIKGKSRSGKNGSRTNDIIRIFLQNGKLEFYVNGIKQYKTIAVDKNKRYIPGMSMYVQGDQISLVQ